MKKIYSLLSVIVLSATAATAQENLIQNPGFETWINGQPENYEPYTGATGSPSINNYVEQETSIVHSGSSSLKHQSQNNTQYIEYDFLIPVESTHNYTLSYWYLDNDDFASTRLWSTWLDADYNTTGSQSDIQLSTYSSNSPDWVNNSVTVTPPAGASYIRYQVRTYRQSQTNVGGYIYYDDFSFVDNTAAGVKQNEIAGLTVSPNPLTGNVLTVKSNSNAAKGVAIFDITGKQVLNTTTANNTVNTGNLTAGVYIVKVTEEGKTATKKLIVQ